MEIFYKKDEEVKKKITEWFKDGVSRGATHLFVVRDNMAWEDYHVYVLQDERIREKYELYGANGDHTVMEIYSLTINMEEQLNEEHSWHMEG